MAFSNVSLLNTFADWMNRLNQMIYIINSATEGNMNTSGSLTITNITGLNGNVSLNVANGTIKGDAGLVTNVRSEILTQNSINVVSNTTHLSVYKTNLGRLGSTVFIDTGTLSTSVSNTSVSAIASANVVNVVHSIAVGGMTIANNANNTAVVAFELANTVNTRSIAAYGQANTGTTTAVAAFGAANNASGLATVAFAKANTVDNVATTLTVVYATANTGVNTAIGAYKTANSAIPNTEIGLQTIWVPAGAITPQTRGAPADTITYMGGDIFNYTLDFDAASAEAGHFVIQLPKSWETASSLNVQTVWSHNVTSNNFGVVWVLNAAAVSDDETASLSYSESVVMTDTGGTTRDIYTTDAATLTIGGAPQTGDIIMFRIYRDVGHASDTMNVDASLHGIRIKYDTTTLKDD